MTKRKQNIDKPTGDTSESLPIGGLLDGVASILGRLGELAEKGEALRREGHFESKSGKDIRGSYGFTVKLGGDGNKVTTEPTVTPHKKTNPQTKAAEQSLVRSPHVDLFEESDHLLIIAEMPGVPVDQVTVRFNERKLLLAGQAARLRFETEIDVPCVCNPDDVSVTANNGVIEIRIDLSR